jgi:hypothetical protein
MVFVFHVSTQRFAWDFVRSFLVFPIKSGFNLNPSPPPALFALVTKLPLKNSACTYKN